MPIMFQYANTGHVIWEYDTFSVTFIQLVRKQNYINIMVNKVNVKCWNDIQHEKPFHWLIL